MKLNFVKYLFGNFEEILGCFLLFGMLALAFANILCRYFFHYPFAFTEEIEIAGLVWITMLGSSIAFKKKSHIGFNFLVNKFSPLFRKYFLIISYLLILILFCFLCGYGINQILDEIELEIISESLGIPQWIYTLAVPAGAILIIMRTASLMIKTIFLKNNN